MTTTNDPNVRVYKLKTDGLSWFQSWRRCAGVRIVVMVLFIAVITVGLNLARGNTFSPRLITFTAIYGLVAIVILNIFSLLSYKRNMPRLQAYELQVSESQIRQIMPGVPDLIVTPDDVVSITESDRYGLFINTHDHNTRLVVWPSVEGYEEIKAQIANWQTIQTPDHISVLRLPQRFFTVVIIASTIGAFGSRNPLIVVPSAVIILGLIVYNFREMPRQSKVLRSERNAIQVFTILYAIVIVLRLIFMLL